MGTRVPVPVEPPPVAAGSACPVCWGSGKQFGDGDTPDQIIASISGVVYVGHKPALFPDFPNGIWTLTQIVGSSCSFRNITPDYAMLVRWDSDRSTFLIFESVEGFIMNIVEMVTCVTEFFNDDFGPTFFGSVFITIPEVD